jgi:hypothetical protein
MQHMPAAIAKCRVAQFWLLGNITAAIAFSEKIGWRPVHRDENLDGTPLRPRNGLTKRCPTKTGKLGSASLKAGSDCFESAQKLNRTRLRMTSETAAPNNSGPLVPIRVAEKEN